MSSRRVVRPRLEVLEGRALLATAAFDSTFGQGGIVAGLLAPVSHTSYEYPLSFALTSDGKMVVVATSGDGQASPSTFKLAVRQFNTNGSLDTTFGTSGETDVPIPTGTTGINSSQPGSVAIKADGSIVLVASAQVTTGTSNLTTNIVAQLTRTGQLDANFGTNGEFTETTKHDFSTGYDLLGTVAVQADGKILVAGTRAAADTISNYATPNLLLAMRLTASGTLDPSFNGTGTLAVAVPGTSAFSFNGYVQLMGIELAVAPSGQIYLGTTLQGEGLKYQADLNGDVARINSDGTVDTAFGTNGHLSLTAAPQNSLNAIAVQSDNKLVIAGNITAVSVASTTSQRQTPFLLRYLPTGTLDSTFTGLPLTYAANEVGKVGSFTSLALGTDGTITAAGTQSNYPSHFLVAQFTATGQVNTAFGLHGQMTFSYPTPDVATGTFYPNIPTVALTSTKQVVVLGAVQGSLTFGFLARLQPNLLLNNSTNDFDGDGKSEIAAELTTPGSYAYRKSTGGDIVQPFGQKGLGLSIPEVGDFDGDGKPDVAVYLPNLGELAYRSTLTGSDVLDAFGPAGVGASIPAVGDYDGDGTTDVAVYLPASGSFAIQSTAGPNMLVPFGVPGVGQSIPAPGDYDGDGRTDLAVYIPSQGILAYRPSSGGKDVSISFGPSGPGASIPTPGDYDGDGKTDVAVYMPASGSFAIHPSSAAANSLIPFGMRGAGNSVPAPGDYDGDGKTDAAVYLPTLGFYAYRPSSGGQDVVQGFGQAGFGATVPATSIPYAIVRTSAGTSAQAGSNAVTPAVFIPLTDDMIVKKKSTTRQS